MCTTLYRTALFAFIVFSNFAARGQGSIGIGTSSPNSNAVLDIVSSGNNKGVLIPRLTTSQRNAMSSSLAPTEVGLMVFDSILNAFFFWDGTNWSSMVLTQDLELVGNILRITNNGAATPIDLSVVQDGVDDADNNPLNEIQNLTFSGNAVGIDGGGAGFNLSPTAPASGQVLKWNGVAWEAATDDTATGAVLPVLANAQIVTNNSSNNLAVSISGDINMNNAGVMTVQPNVVDSTNITNNSVTSADIRDGTITSTDIIGNGVTSFNILNNTITNIDVSATAAILGTKISPNFGTQNILTTGNVGVGVAVPLVTLDVRGNQILGTGLAPVALTSGNMLNLQVGISADGDTNGIGFFENGGGFGMKLGYNGEGSATNNKLVIYDNTDTEIIAFENGGNVGLGVANPAQKLEVDGNITVTSANQLFINRISSVDNIANFMGWDVGGTGVFRIHTGANSVIYGEPDGRVRIGTQGNSSSAKLLVQGAGNGTGISLLTRSSLGTPRFVVLDNGNVGIKRTPVTNDLEVGGTASKASAGAWLANSDRRIKTNITDIDNSIELIKKIRPVKFKYTEYWKKENPSIEDRFYYNFIAQEYQEVFPNAVKGSGEYIEDDPTEILQIDTYDAQITGLKALQELIYRVEALENENRLLKAELETSRQFKAEIEIAKLKNNNIEIRKEYENLKLELIKIKEILSITGLK